VSASKSIQRQPFGVADATPVAPLGDLWWGGSSQNGWGVAISQQYRTLFSVWYTYDPDGHPLWYVIPGGSWIAANVFTGTAYRTRGSPWIGRPYDPAQLSPQAVGTVTFTFHDANNATMSYAVEGVTQSKAIVRQPF
jgi:chitinase